MGAKHKWTESTLAENDLHSDYSLFFRFYNIPSFIVPLRYIWIAKKQETGPEEATTPKSHFDKRGPSIFPPKHTRALHLSPGMPPVQNSALCKVNVAEAPRGKHSERHGFRNASFFTADKRERPELAPRFWSHRIDGLPPPRGGCFSR